MNNIVVEVLVEILLNILDPKSAMTCKLQHSICVKGLWQTQLIIIVSHSLRLFHVPDGLSLGRLPFPCKC